MKVEYYKMPRLDDLYNHCRYNHVETLLCDSDKVVGYHKVVAAINLTLEEQTAYIVKRFDGRLFMISSGYDILKMYQKETNLYGDIVNIEINNKKERDEKVRAVEHHCIPLKKYCPTITGITKYIEHEFYTNTVRAKEFENFYKPVCVNRDTLINIKANTSLEEMNKIKKKLNMIGVPSLIVDINTIAVLSNNGKEVIFYTTQPNIFASYICEKIGVVNIKRNYEYKDIPKSQYDKYIYRCWG
jgi:hypothetical protein